MIKDKLYKTLEGFCSPETDFKSRIRSGMFHLTQILAHDHHAQLFAEQDWVRLNTEAQALLNQVKISSSDDVLQAHVNEVVSILLGAYGQIDDSKQPEPLG